MERGQADGAGPEAVVATSSAGARIRARRLALGLRQAELARRCDVSAPYLNLIEHGRRRIGGALLTRLARALDTEPAALARGAGQDAIGAMRAAAAMVPAAPPPALAEAEALAARHPGWAALIAAQAERLRALERTVAELRDRLSHDPRLAGSLHEVLTVAAAIRSTTAILGEPGDIDEAWRRRFLRNLVEDAERLAAGAEALAGSMADAPAGAAAVETPRAAAEAWLAARPDLPARLEAGGGPGELPADAEVRARLAPWLARIAADVARLPEPALAPARRAGGAAADPAALAHALGVPVPLVLRRLGWSGAGGLAVCDAGGALVLRLPLRAFPMPRGAPCPLWPLYAALGAPGRPVRRLVETPGPDGGRFECWAAAEVSHPGGLGGVELAEAVMLVRPAAPRVAGRGAGGPGEPVPVGPGCRTCPRGACPARREPPLFAPAAPL